MDVETIAVNAVSGPISKCSHIKAIFESNDKTLFTDGYIDVYSAERKSKADWLGRVTVQVKGRQRGHKKRAKPTFSIDRIDLVAFQKDSGVLYFYVSVDAKTGDATPYYALLSPFAIDDYLRAAPAAQQKVPVRWSPFPSNVNSIQSLVELALKTRGQNITTGFDPVLFENLESLTLHTASTLNLNAPLTLTPGSLDYSLVLNTSGGLSVHLSGELQILPHDYLEQPVNVRVSSGGITFDSVTKKRLAEDKFEVRISDGLVFVARETEEGHSTQIRLTLEDSLEGRLKSVEFYLALIDSGSIQFDGKPVSFDINVTAEDEELRRNLASLKEMAALFDALGVDKALLNLRDITTDQFKQLYVLHRAIVLNEEIVDPNAERSRVIQKVGKWSLMFILTAGSTPEKWRVLDPFNPESRHQFRWSADKEEPIPVTSYDIVSDEDLGSVLNMRLPEIVGAYETIADLPSTYSLANQRVLSLLRASDANDGRASELLEAAAALNGWLLESQPGEPHHAINQWQIALRQRALTSEERSDIRALKRTLTTNRPANSTQFEIACALLLHDTEEAEDLIRDLSSEELLQMQKWPIWRLHDGTLSLGS